MRAPVRFPSEVVEAAPTARVQPDVGAEPVSHPAYAA